LDMKVVVVIQLHSYTVTLDENPSVEQVQTYTTKPQTPTSYVLY